MLDLKYIEEHVEEVKKRLASRNADVDIDGILELNRMRKALIAEHDKLRHEQKEISEGFKKKGITKEERAQLKQKAGELGRQVKQLDEKIRTVEEELRQRLLFIPNLPDEDVPVGPDESGNVEVSVWGERPEFDFEVKPHYEIGEKLGILDFKRAAKISGSRFVVYKGLGARLERALANFMLDLHVKKHGYEEVFPPFLVTQQAMEGTGQLPKFAQEAYKTQDDLYLIPTAEVPVTNLHRDEMLDAKELPKHYVAYSACFRREAGSHGKDVRGIIRVHQFQKVEMVKFCMPEESNRELEKMVEDATDVLKTLGLHHRVVQLCTGDLGFSAAKCFDIEVWMPAQQRFREISSCSNCRDFQARRARIRFKRDAKSKPEFVHTLNGSGVAIGRTVAAILENYQLPDGSVRVPEALVPYMGVEVIKP